MRFLLSIGLTLFGSLYIVNSSVDAQQPDVLSLSVAPAIVETTVNPGETKSVDVYITNNSTETIPVSLEVQSLTSYQEDSLLDTELSDAANWIAPETDVLILESNQTKKINVTVEVPNDAFSGGHYAQLNARALLLEEEVINQQSISIPEISISFLVIVPGDLNVEFKFDSNNIFPIFTKPETNIDYNFSIENVGNTHSIATPILVLKNRSGEEILREQIKSQLILPKTSREFVGSWQTPTNHGRYHAEIELAVGGSDNSISSGRELVIVTHPLIRLVIFFVITVTLIHLIKNYRNIHSAFIALRYGKPND